MSASPTTLVGNLTRDPETTATQGGTPKTTFGIAVNHSWRNADGDWEEDVSFFNVIAWRNLAEDCGVLEKGTRVVVTGRLDQRSFEGDDGSTRNWVELVADDVAVSVKAIDGYTRKQRDDANSNGRGAAPTRRSSGGRAPARASTSRRRQPADAIPADEPF